MLVSLTSNGETEYEYTLRGKDWDVYWLLLRKGFPMSVRQVQRSLNFSSPSVAFHHLEQLRKLGLVEKQRVGGDYFLTENVKIGVLRHFIKLGRMLFPRYFFYAVFSTTSYLAFLLILMQDLTRESMFVMFFGAVISIILWYEAIRIWNLKPF